MRLVIVESPYAGDIEKNVRYARAALADCLARGEAPYASHLLYTQPGVLDDTVPEERTLGIKAGLRWGRLADATVVYDDLGVSSGMKQGIERAAREGRSVEYRSIDFDTKRMVSAEAAIFYGLDTIQHLGSLTSPPIDDEDLAKVQAMIDARKENRNTPTFVAGRVHLNRMIEAEREMMGKTPANIGELIRVLRKRSMMSIEAVARWLGISTDDLTKLELHTPTTIPCALALASVPVQVDTLLVEVRHVVGWILEQGRAGHLVAEEVAEALDIEPDEAETLIRGE